MFAGLPVQATLISLAQASGKFFKLGKLQMLELGVKEWKEKMPNLAEICFSARNS